MKNENDKYEEFEYFLGGYYHEDTWEDHATHQEIWEDFIKNETKEQSIKLLNELKKITQNDTVFVIGIINKINPHGLNLRSEKETKEWLDNCIKYFQINLEVK